MEVELLQKVVFFSVGFIFLAIGTFGSYKKADILYGVGSLLTCSIVGFELITMGFMMFGPLVLALGVLLFLFMI